MKRMTKLLMKGTFLLALVALFSFFRVDAVKAETVPAATSIEITDAGSKVDIDWDSIFGALKNQEIVDGTQIAVDDSYLLVGEVIIEPIGSPSTPSLSKDSSELSGISAAASSYSSSYTGTCNVYVYLAGTNTFVAVITHNVTVMYFDNNKIHISSGSLSVSSLNPNISGYAYGYNIVNTDGSYSYAYGMVELYNSYSHLYTYFGANASVTPGTTPSFTFNQV